MPARRRSAVYDEVNRYIMRRVREARVEAGMTQGEVAKELGRPVSYISKCELGQRNMVPGEIDDFARLFDKPIAYFYPPRKRRKSR